MHVQRTNPVVNNRISGLYNHVTSAEYNAIVCDNVSVCPNNQCIVCHMHTGVTRVLYLM